MRETLQSSSSRNIILSLVSVWLSGLVVSALGIRSRWSLDSRVVPLFHWVATLGKLFTHTLPPQFLSSKKLGYKWELSAP